MSSALATTALLGLFAAVRTAAFVAPNAPYGNHGLVASRSMAAHVGSCSLRQPVAPLSMSTDTEAGSDAPEVYFAAEVVEQGKTKIMQEFGDTGAEGLRKKKVVTIPTNGTYKGAPDDYSDLIDGDTFDGGDGQVGCVGSGSSGLEKIGEDSDRRVVTVQNTWVKQSKDRQRNAFGSFTGYADQLKEQGLVKENLYGEDVMKVRRQQFENWRNQQELQKEQRAKQAELDRITGRPEGASKKSGSYLASFSQQNDQPEDLTVVQETVVWKEVDLKNDEKITGTIDLVSVTGRPGFETIQVKSTVMTYEPYHCVFVGDHTGFDVDPKEGTLNRRSGDPTPVKVSYKSSGPGSTGITTLVIATEEDKWVYRLTGRSE